MSGQTVQFSVQATGTGPLRYQWMRNGTQIDSGTAASLSFPATLQDDGARYSVRVSNSAGAVNSNEAVLRVTPSVVPPSIVKSPAALQVQAGQPAQFVVEAAGSAQLVYQWLRNGVAINGATSSTYTLAEAQPEDNGASFTVSVSNAAGAVSSTSVTLTVTPAPVAPVIAALNAPSSVSAGGSATFTVTANGTGPLQYQWFENGVAIEGATGASHTVVNASVQDHLKAYSVAVVNAAGSTRSAPAILRLAPVPEVNVGRTGCCYVAFARGPVAGLFSWGQNVNGQLGRLADDTEAITPGLVPSWLPSGVEIRQVSVGHLHTAVLASDGSVWSWGANVTGEYGNGTVAISGLPPADGTLQPPVKAVFPSGTVLRAVGAGDRYSVALDSAGQLWAWGAVHSGVGSSSATPTKLNVPAEVRFTAVSVSETFALALDTTGRVWGWGVEPAVLATRTGPNLQPSVLNLTLPAGRKVVSVFAGVMRAVAVTDDGNAYAWGDNTWGRSGPTASHPPLSMFPGCCWTWHPVWPWCKQQQAATTPCS
ncbi:hypothetical protein [Caldimonas brevitalea]|uniref:Ig-like domain-containing protein n=1 Tax=Caldimonas brevitalea TaxID=413882 RepID=A0A0G3BR07_9BURK|nr:hypothetical protein AAW51_5166 [Caldimonas brevitalea]